MILFHWLLRLCNSLKRCSPSLAWKEARYFVFLPPCVAVLNETLLPSDVVLGYSMEVCFDSCTVSLYSPIAAGICPQLGLCKGTVVGLWKTEGISTGHVSPQDTASCPQFSSKIYSYSHSRPDNLKLCLMSHWKSWISFNLSMDQYLHQYLWFVRLNYLSMPKLQRCKRWRLGMNKLFHHTPYWAYDYLSMLELGVPLLVMRSSLGCIVARGHGRFLECSTKLCLTMCYVSRKYRC